MYFRFFVFKESSTDNIWSIFDRLFTKENGITIDNLYKEDDTLVKKSIVYSTQFTYYFVHGQYKKIANLFQRFNKEKSDSKYINIEAQRGTMDKDSLLLSLKTLVITLMYNKEINNSKYRNSYIYELNAASERGYIDDYLSDPAVLLLHQRVMHDVFENSRSAIRDAHSRFGWRQLSLLDRMESDPQFLERFLDNFNPDAWSPINSRNHYSIRDDVPEMDENKERLVRIFNSYLYTKYGSGQKYSNLEKIISEMTYMLEVLGYEELGILDIVDGLPEKIQRAALKNMVGE